MPLLARSSSIQLVGTLITTGRSSTASGFGNSVYLAPLVLKASIWGQTFGISDGGGADCFCGCATREATAGELILGPDASCTDATAGGA